VPILFLPFLSACCIDCSTLTEAFGCIIVLIKSTRTKLKAPGRS
jgi:hypothetical protein